MLISKLDRAAVVDKNFIERVRSHDFPKPLSNINDEFNSIEKSLALQIFESQMISRLLDIYARVLKEKGLSFYTIGSSGHEGNAAIAAATRLTDMAFLHYRSAAFYIQRARLLPKHDPISDLLRSFVAASTDPIASGRHKVLGSKALYIPPQTSTIASHLPKAVGTAFSLRRAKELDLSTRVLPDDSIIVCSFGDASVNHSVALSAFNTAEWLATQKYPLPILFVCEDNGIGISVPTPKHWIENKFSHSGLQYLVCDGLNFIEVYHVARQAAEIARIKKQPTFLHMKTVRLLGHAGSDVESQYRKEQNILADEAQDPLLHSARLMVEANWLSSEEIVDQYLTIKNQIVELAKPILAEPKLTSAKEIMSSLIPSASPDPLPTLPSHAQRQVFFAEKIRFLSEPRNMCQNLNTALADILLQYPNVVVFGEDVGKKGGVYRVTADLQASFGLRRVFDTLLDETSILGMANGLSHNGFIPIPEIQFLAYYHNAEDQIRGEASTLSFFSNGQYTNPMVLRIASLAYQKGFGGHFHNDNSIAALRDVPGLVIACPSSGADAAKMLRTAVSLAYRERRVVIFLEPIALYMTRDLHQDGDNQWLEVYPDPKESLPLGELGIYGESEENIIITYGNGYYLSRQAAEILQKVDGIRTKIIDLRWLAPLNETAILSHTHTAKRVLIVDECRRTGSISEALLALLLENSDPLPKIARITGLDSFIPLGQAWKSVLPSKEDIVEGMKKLHELRKVNK